MDKICATVFPGDEEFSECYSFCCRETFSHSDNEGGFQNGEFL